MTLEQIPICINQLSLSFRSPIDTKQSSHQRHNDYTANYLASLSTTSGLGSNYTTNTSGMSPSSLSSHRTASPPCRKCGSSSEENMHSLSTAVTYHQHHPQQQQQIYQSPVHHLAHQQSQAAHLRTPVQAFRAYETDIYYNHYGASAAYEPRSTYGGHNTPELSRSPYRLPTAPTTLGTTASSVTTHGHRRTMSSNFTGARQNYFVDLQSEPPPILNASKNPFLNMIVGTHREEIPLANRMYENVNVPFTPTRNLYSISNQNGSTSNNEHAELLERTFDRSSIRSSLKSSSRNHSTTGDSLDLKEEESFSSSSQPQSSSGGGRVLFSPEHFSPRSSS